MSTETTVLLLEAESLPSTLEEQLTKRGVFVEHASGSEVALMLPVIVPDLVVQSGSLAIDPTIKALQNEKSAAPLVIIADRASIRELREAEHAAIHALIPADLPIAAIAHRLATMARRSLEGSPLEGGNPNPKNAVASPAKKLSPAGKPSTAKAPSPAPQDPQQKSERGSLAPLPLAPRQQVKIVDPEERIQREDEQLAREQAALRQAEAEQRAVEDARQKSRALAEEKSRLAAEKRRAELEQRALVRSRQLEERKKEQAMRLEERRREQELKREERIKAQERRAKERASLRVEAQRSSVRPQPPENTQSELKALDDLFSSAVPEPATIRSSNPPESARAMDRSAQEELEQTTQAVDISAFAPELDKLTQGEAASVSALSPDTTRQDGAPARRKAAKNSEADFGSVKKSEDLSVIIPLPVDMRVDLAPKTDLSPIRLALLDTDLTRADAVAAELRERGMKIHPVTPDPGRTRWPMLRRFAPQGLVVDEKSMPRGAAEWVETFRGDPFLRHVPVVLVRFSRVFDEASGKVSLDPLLHMIEHIGREEFALLEKLGPGRRVDLWLSQVAPYRLVEMLTKEDRNTRLDCRGKNERMVWHLGPGYAGRGKLADLATDAPKQRLSPSEALTWLLSHEDCQVAVHEHAEPLAHASESVDAEELLREMTEALGAPLRHESVRPGGFRDAQEPLSTPGVDAREAAPARPMAPTFPTRTATADLPIQLPMSRAPFFSSNQRAKLTARLRASSATLKRGYESYERAARSRLRPLESKVPNSVLKHAPWLLLTVLALALVLVVLLVGGKTGSKETPIAPTADSAELKTPLAPAANKKGAAPEPSAAEGQEAESEETGDLWRVVSENELPTCEERLGASAPKGLDPVRASGYWKAARRLLMLGNSEEAIESLCLAGLFDPSGPASEGLAEYYLGQRALAQAERWIKESLKSDPDRRKSKELLGDIENQKGNVENARNILLETLQLRSDETKRMEVTARKLQNDARLARKGGDLARAERELRRAALLSPESAEIAAELGDTLLRREAPAAAARWAAQSLKLDPNYATAMLLAARVAEALGKKDKAREFYEMVPLGDPYHDEAQRRRGRL